MSQISLASQSNQNLTKQIKKNKSKLQQKLLEKKFRQLELEECIEKDQQILQEIQYYVFEDLLNFFEILTDVLVTIEHFQNDPQHAYIPVALNRLIVQTNLSNLITFDCLFRYNSGDQEKIYKNEKQEAYYVFNQLIQEINYSKSQTIIDCVNCFKQNFSNQKSIQQLNLLQTQVQVEFNQSVVQKVFAGMSEVDQKKQQISKGEYKKLKKEDIEQLINKRKERAIQMLSDNFGKSDRDENDRTNHINELDIL